MNRPTLTQFTKNLSLDNTLKTVNRKEYSKALEAYCDHLENYKKYVDMMVSSSAMPSNFTTWENSLNLLPEPY